MGARVGAAKGGMVCERGEGRNRESGGGLETGGGEEEKRRRGGEGEAREREG